jgi:hypothetical protein
MKQETLEEAAQNKFGLVDPILGKSDYRMGYERGLIDGAKWQQERMYSEEDMKQYACQCVANFLSNSKNELEQSLIEVIINRNNDEFNQFKK